MHNSALKLWNTDTCMANRVGLFNKSDDTVCYISTRQDELTYWYLLNSKEFRIKFFKDIYLGNQRRDRR